VWTTTLLSDWTVRLTIWRSLCSQCFSFVLCCVFLKPFDFNQVVVMRWYSDWIWTSWFIKWSRFILLEPLCFIYFSSLFFNIFYTIFFIFLSIFYSKKCSFSFKTFYLLILVLLVYFYYFVVICLIVFKSRFILCLSYLSLIYNLIYA